MWPVCWDGCNFEFVTACGDLVHTRIDDTVDTYLDEVAREHQP
jgi:hypothetical protein